MNENPINVHCVWIINFGGFEKIRVWGRRRGGGMREGWEEGVVGEGEGVKGAY